MDMQSDRLVTAIHSYLLGDSIGMTGGLDAICSVTVDGVSLPGYIDIGLIDTMLDMLLESAGAVLTAIWLLLSGEEPIRTRPKLKEKSES